jgi:hypothetical protein
MWRMFIYKLCSTLKILAKLHIIVCRRKSCLNIPWLQIQTQWLVNQSHAYGRKCKSSFDWTLATYNEFKTSTGLSDCRIMKSRRHFSLHLNMTADDIVCQVSWIWSKTNNDGGRVQNLELPWKWGQDFWRMDGLRLHTARQKTIPAPAVPRHILGLRRPWRQNIRIITMF